MAGIQWNVQVLTMQSVFENDSSDDTKEHLSFPIFYLPFLGELIVTVLQWLFLLRVIVEFQVKRNRSFFPVDLFCNY